MKDNGKIFIGIAFPLLVLFYAGVYVTKSAIVPLIVLLLLSFYFSFICKLQSVYYFALCTVFQGVVLIIFAPYISSGESNGLIITKELLVYICTVEYFVVCLKKRRLGAIDLCFFAFCILAVIGIIKSNSVGLAVAGLRQILIVFVCYFAGSAIKQDKKSREKLSGFFIQTAIIVAIIGFALYFMSDSDWLKIGYADYWENRTGGNVAYDFVNFYSWDLGVRIKRLVSSFANPIACAHYLCIGFTFLFVGEKKCYLGKIVVAIALVLCISKAAVVVVMSIILVKNYTRIRNKLIRTLFIALCIFIGLVGVLILSDYSSSLTMNTAIGNHFNAFIYGIKNGSLLGNGLGTIGYNASLAGLSNYDTGFNESFFALTIGQMGYLGMFLLYLFWILSALSCYKRYQSLKDPFCLTSLILLVAVIVESLFSASSVSMLGTGLYFILAGMCNPVREVKLNKYLVGRRKSRQFLSGTIHFKRTGGFNPVE